MLAQPHQLSLPLPHQRLLHAASPHACVFACGNPPVVSVFSKGPKTCACMPKPKPHPLMCVFTTPSWLKANYTCGHVAFVPTYR